MVKKFFCSNRYVGAYVTNNVALDVGHFQLRNFGGVVYM